MSDESKSMHEMNENLALQSNDGLPFHAVDNDYIIAYSKSTEEGSNLVRLRQRVRTERSFYYCV